MAKQRLPAREVRAHARPTDSPRGFEPRCRSRDLLRSPPDVLASTANFLANHGWQRGKDWEPGSANFAAIKEWNKSEVYARTIAHFATQLSRAP